MRNFAIFARNTKKDSFPGMDIQTVEIDGVPVHCAIVETDDPEFDRENPKNSQHVLVRVKAFSLNYRDKSLIFRMTQNGPDHGMYVIGSEFAAEVLETGAAVTEFAPGDLVIGNNAYPSSGFSGVPPGVPTNHSSKEIQAFHKAKLAKIPFSMPVDTAAAFGIGAQTTYSMLRRLELFEGANVLVASAKSNTSLFAINALKNRRVNAYAVSTSDAFESKLKGMGIKDLCVIPVSANFQDHPVIAEIASQGGFDFVIDPYWDLHLSRSIQVMGFGAKYITCGLFDQYLSLIGKPMEEAPHNGQELVNVMMKNLSIMGNCIGTTGDLTQALEDYETGSLNAVIDSVFTEGAAAFLHRCYCARERFGKVVYRYS